MSACGSGQSSVLGSCRGSVGNEAFMAGRINSPQEGLTQVHFQTYWESFPFSQCKSKVICKDTRMVNSIGTRIFCDVLCSSDLLVSSSSLH